MSCCLDIHKPFWPNGSVEILKILLRDEALADGVNLSAIAKETDRFSGSDLKRMFLCSFRTNGN